jgi:hypothetical protein
VTFVGAVGAWFTIRAGCEPTEPPPVDAYWTLVPGPEPGSVISAEGEPCTVESRARCLTASGGEPLCNTCSAGDGKLDIGAGIQASSGIYCFRFGNRARETGVDLAPFRELLRSFRALDGNGRFAR